MGTTLRPVAAFVKYIIM